jgi:hypothetical protein
VGVSSVNKRDFPRDAVFGRSQRSVLVLVTCGGAFDPDSGYEDNVIVFARPV